MKDQSPSDDFAAGYAAGVAAERARMQSERLALISTVHTAAVDFILEACEVGPYDEGAPAIYAAWRAWASSSGRENATDTAMGRALSDLGFEKRRTNGRVLRVGLRLRKPQQLGSDGTVTV